MKKNIKIIIVFFSLLAILYLIIVFTYPIRIKTNDYSIEIYSDGAHITKYWGDDKDVRLPNFVGIIPVTVIDKNCFDSNDKIETVFIPNNIKFIRSEAFIECSNLEAIEAEKIKCVDDDVFAYDNQLEIVELGDNLQIIGKNAFEGCGMLTYIPSKDSVKEIGDHAFKGCEIEDPGDLTGITVGEDAFVDCPWSESPNNPHSANYVDPEDESEE